MLQERQAHQRNVQFTVPVGDEVLIDKEHTQLRSRVLLSLRCIGPRVHGAQHAPPRHPRQMAWRVRVFPEFNIERLWPKHRRPDRPTESGADGGQST